MKVKSQSEVAQLCPTPSDPTDCSLPGRSVHGIFQARVLEWGATAFSTDAQKINSVFPIPTNLIADIKNEVVSQEIKTNWIIIEKEEESHHFLEEDLKTLEILLRSYVVW